MFGWTEGGTWIKRWTPMKTSTGGGGPVLMM